MSKGSEINWKKIIEGVAKSDSAMTHQFVESAQKPLYKFCYYLTNNQQLAEDICHDSLIKGITKIESLKNPDQTMAWLKQIARRQFLDYVKSASQSKVHVDIDEMNSGEQELSGGDPKSEAQILALQALQNLSPEERAIVEAIRNHPDGLGIDEIAWKTQIPVNNLASQLLTLEFTGLIKMLPGKKYQLLQI